MTGLRISETLDADIADLASDRGHRTLSIVRKGDRHATIPCHPAPVEPWTATSVKASRTN